MHRQIKPDSSVWLLTMSLAGAGCAFMGPYLQIVATRWHLRDAEAGLILSCVFVGSFFGNMLIARDLRRNLWAGSLSASVGLLVFSICTHHPGAFPVGAASLSLTGFGLGQLMSSINLIVGSAPIETRARALANLGTAWCIGAVLSPVLTTVMIQSLSPIARLAVVAPLYLLPAVASLFRKPSVSAPATARPQAVHFSSPVLLWALSFFIYGGIEASIAGWLPTFALRYQVTSVVSSQWVVSVFWSGLIASRLLTAIFVTPRNQRFVIRIALLGAAGCVLWFLALPAPLSLVSGIACAGICLGPLFPLFLASSLELHLGPRVMGIILASCGLGNAIFPWLLGAISSQSSLRVAMLAPLASLIGLYLLRSGRHGEISKQPLPAV